VLHWRHTRVFFVVQIVTGILLAFYYQPSPATAYESVRYITEEASYGWYLRGLHKWGATLMIAAVVLHQMRVFFTGAYRRPRELNWMVGMTLLVCTLMLGFTGYSLVFEQLSYWGATVGANISDTSLSARSKHAARRRFLQRRTLSPSSCCTPRLAGRHDLLALPSRSSGRRRLRQAREEPRRRSINFSRPS
jgi:hypothetical protein